MSGTAGIALPLSPRSRSSSPIVRVRFAANQWTSAGASSASSRTRQHDGTRSPQCASRRATSAAAHASLWPGTAARNRASSGAVMTGRISCARICDAIIAKSTRTARNSGAFGGWFWRATM